MSDGSRPLAIAAAHVRAIDQLFANVMPDGMPKDFLADELAA